MFTQDYNKCIYKMQQVDVGIIEAVRLLAAGRSDEALQKLDELLRFTRQERATPEE
jgi:hypothetical protein